MAVVVVVLVLGLRRLRCKIFVTVVIFFRERERNVLVWFLRYDYVVVSFRVYGFSAGNGKTLHWPDDGRAVSFSWSVKMKILYYYTFMLHQVYKKFSRSLDY